MVILHIKRHEESLFLYETTQDSPVDTVMENIARIYNCRLKILRLCAEMEQLIMYGPVKPPEEDIAIDEWCQQFEAKGGTEVSKNSCEKRIGKTPLGSMKDVLIKAVDEARMLVSNDQVKSSICLSQDHIYEALDILRGAVNVVYPMNLPLHDPVRCELENREEPSQSEEFRKVIPPSDVELWFASNKMNNEKKLKDYLGKNEKTKAVVKLQRKGQGIPMREPVISEEEKRNLMMTEFRRREELKKLELDEDHCYLDSEWADNNHLKKSFHGLSSVSWKPH